MAKIIDEEWEIDDDDPDDFMPLHAEFHEDANGRPFVSINFFEPWTPASHGVMSKPFSKKELKDIFIATSVLGVALAFVFTGGLFPRRGGEGFLGKPIDVQLTFLALGFFIASTGFVLHELGHKFVARRYGAWAEFRASQRGLILAGLMSVFGFLLAAPGAVMIAGNLDRKQNGIVSVAGPGVNVVLALICLPLMLVVPSFAGVNFFAWGLTLNLILAGFNLLPIGPLDGRKILHWSLPVYVTMGAIIAGLGVLGWVLFFSILGG